MTVTFDLRSQLLQIMPKPMSAQPAGGHPTTACPHVSVVIPAYNVAPYIAETLDSVLAQTFADYEVIVVNDGSADDLEAALQPYRDRICYLKQENLGAGPARNAGILQARGGLIAFLDGDDVWLPDFLASQVKFLEQNNYDLVYADAHIFGDAPTNGRTYMQDAPSVGPVTLKSLLEASCNVITSGTLARKQALVDAGLFMRENIRGQDFNMWARMAHKGARLGYQKKVLLKYRVRVGSLSGNSMQRLERGMNNLRRLAGELTLTGEEKQAVAGLLARGTADWQVERGKSLLLQEDFPAAAAAFAEANTYRHSPYLSAIIWLLRFAPRLLLKIYRTRRAAEIRFVPQPEERHDEPKHA